jgi:23S rRNA (guanine745-N1)-methyltransferase
LAFEPGRAACPRRHSFDIARQGYLNLLNGPQPKNADTWAMLAARGRVHDAGLFDPVADAVAAAVSGARTILEAGAGTAHYLARCLDAGVGLDARKGLALDVSTAAARVAAKRPRVAAVVADVWKTLPLADAGFDAVLCVFAPRNLAEFARVLRPGGRLIAVTPNPGHLAAVRSAHALLAIPADKGAALERPPFELVDAVAVRYAVPLSRAQVADLIAMGPNAFHHPPANTLAVEDHVDVTVWTLERR